MGIRITRSEELKDKLQTTIEKEPDFIRLVESDQGEKFILHLEFQSLDEEGMIYRMQEYFGLLRRKYRMPVKQFVIYLGQKPSGMQYRLAPQDIFEGFTLTSLRDYSYRSLLVSDVPEEIILAVLSDFEDKKPAEVIKGILGKLKEISHGEIVLRKYTRQLSVLARLRNLTEETQKEITEMGLTYNITEDYLYQQGKETRNREIVVKMLKDKTLTIEKIAEILDVTVEYVKGVASQLKD